MDFCTRLKQLRLQSHFMQKEIADSIGISVRAFQRYEHGDSQPNIETLIKLADFFQVSLDFLVGRNFHEADAEKH